MAGLSDSLTIGILLLLIFGAATFYLYSRMCQTEKRLSLLENVLLTLKMSTEASLMGPDSVEAVSYPSPLNSDDVDDVDEEQYAEMLRSSPSPSSPSSNLTAPASSAAQPEVSSSQPAAEVLATSEAEAEAEELLRSMSFRKMDVNYESMSVKELQALAKNRGLSGAPTKKRELVDFLKKSGVVPESSPQPLAAQPGDLMDLADAEVSNGFTVELESSQ
jgi:hypothetical protein